MPIDRNKGATKLAHHTEEHTCIAPRLELAQDASYLDHDMKPISGLLPNVLV